MNPMDQERRIPLNISDIIIDPEFRDKIPRQTDAEFSGLREDILRDGYVRDPLTVWKEENILLDGHHRWDVITENWELLKDQFHIDYRSLPNRWAAIAWICNNQLHKHNLNDLQKSKLIQEEHDATIKSVSNADGRNQYSQEEVGGQNDHQPKTREIIAKEHGISEGRVKRDVEFGRGVDAGEEVSPGFTHAMLSGQTKASKKDVAVLRNIEDVGERKAAAEKILAGEKLEPETIKSLRGYKEPLVQRTSTLDGTAKKVDEEFADVLEDLNLTADTFLRQFEKTLRENRKIVKVNLAEVVSVMERVKKSLEKMERRF